nr:hypothetical protein [Tanacetum cinerariifolium]
LKTPFLLAGGISLTFFILSFILSDSYVDKTVLIPLAVWNLMAPWMVENIIPIFCIVVFFSNISYGGKAATILQLLQSSFLIGGSRWFCTYDIREDFFDLLKFSIRSLRALLVATSLALIHVEGPGGGSLSRGVTILNLERETQRFPINNAYRWLGVGVNMSRHKSSGYMQTIRSKRIAEVDRFHFFSNELPRVGEDSFLCFNLQRPTTFGISSCPAPFPVWSFFEPYYSFSVPKNPRRPWLKGWSSFTSWPRSSVGKHDGSHMWSFTGVNIWYLRRYRGTHWWRHFSFVSHTEKVGSKSSWGDFKIAKSWITCVNTNRNIALSEAQGASLRITSGVREDDHIRARMGGLRAG